MASKGELLRNSFLPGRNSGKTMLRPSRVVNMEAMPDELDLERLYEEHAQALFAFLLNFTRNEQDTPNLMQALLRPARPRAPGLPRGRP